MNLQDIRHQTDAAQIKAYVLELENTPVLNISQVGLSLQTEHPLVIGQTYALHLKSAQERVILNAIVVRCHLSELGEGSDGIQKPLYHSGVEFHMERNPKEERLMSILQDNLYGEKRLGASRITPTKEMKADICKPVFTEILRLTTHNIFVRSTELLDMDVNWPILIQSGEDCMAADCHIVQGSKKDGDSDYQMELEFLNPTQEMVTFLGRTLTQIRSQMTSDSIDAN